MNKILNFTETVRFSKKERKKGKTIGLVTGCFDIVHFGHVNLFLYAKSKVDILIVGLENDKTIKLNKGSKRPIHNFRLRSRLLSEFSSIDAIFKIKQVLNFSSNETNQIFQGIYQRIYPHHLITNAATDKFWRKKRPMQSSLE